MTIVVVSVCSPHVLRAAYFCYFKKEGFRLCTVNPSIQLALFLLLTLQTFLCGLRPRNFASQNRRSLAIYGSLGPALNGFASFGHSKEGPSGEDKPEGKRPAQIVSVIHPSKHQINTQVPTSKARNLGHCKAMLSPRLRSHAQHPDGATAGLKKERAPSGGTGILASGGQRDFKEIPLDSKPF